METFVVTRYMLQQVEKENKQLKKQLEQANAQLKRANDNTSNFRDLYQATLFKLEFERSSGDLIVEERRYDPCCVQYHTPRYPNCYCPINGLTRARMVGRNRC